MLSGIGMVGRVGSPPGGNIPEPGFTISAGPLATITDGDPAGTAVCQLAVSNETGAVTFSQVSETVAGLQTSAAGAVTLDATAAWPTNPSATYKATDDTGDTVNTVTVTPPVQPVAITSIQGTAITADAGDDPATATSTLSMTGGQGSPTFATSSPTHDVTGTTLTCEHGLDEGVHNIPISVLDAAGQTAIGSVAATISAITLAQSHAGAGWQMWTDPDATTGYRGVVLSADAVGRWVTDDTIPTSADAALDFNLLGSGTDPQQTNDLFAPANARLAIYSTVALTWGATGGAWSEVSGFVNLLNATNANASTWYTHKVDAATITGLPSLNPAGGPAQTIEVYRDVGTGSSGYPIVRTSDESQANSQTENYLCFSAYGKLRTGNVAGTGVILSFGSLYGDANEAEARFSFTDEDIKSITAGLFTAPEARITSKGGGVFLMEFRGQCNAGQYTTLNMDAIVLIGIGTSGGQVGDGYQLDQPLVQEFSTLQWSGR